MLICGFDINRSNIPFGSLDICVPNKIDDGTTAKAARPSWIKNLLFERRGDLRSPEVVSDTVAHPSVAARLVYVAFS